MPSCGRWGAGGWISRVRSCQRRVGAVGCLTAWPSGLLRLRFSHEDPYRVSFAALGDKVVRDIRPGAAFEPTYIYRLLTVIKSSLSEKVSRSPSSRRPQPRLAARAPRPRCPPMGHLTI